MPPSTLDLAAARVTLVSALVWRAIAEIARRRDATYQIKLSQAHPGISPRGAIYLELNPKGVGLAPAAIWFNLGGPSGTYQNGPSDSDRQHSLLDLLGPDPSAAITEMERYAGLPKVTGPLPPSTATVLSLRLAASMLERRVFLPDPWRITLEAFDTHAGTTVCDWSGKFTVPSSADRGARSVLLVHKAPDDCPQPEQHRLSGAALAIEYALGKLAAVTARTWTPIDSAQHAYSAGGRKMDRVVAWADAELDSALNHKDDSVS